MKKYFILIKKINSLFWSRVVNSTTLDVKSLCAFRIILGIFLLTLKFPSFSWIADLPQGLFYPPILSIANIFDGFPGSNFFLVLDILLLISLTCITLGVKARTSTILFIVLYVVGLSFNYSFGKIDHGTTLLIFTLVCMSFSGWGTHLALCPDKKIKADSPNISLSLLSVILCFGMFTAGLPKALSWIDFDTSTSGFLSWYRQGFYNLGRVYFLAPYVNFLPNWIFEVFDYSAVLLELTPFFFLLHSKKAWRIWLLIATIFHLSNCLLLNIPFTLNGLVYLAFIDFSWLYRKIVNNLNRIYYPSLLFLCGVVLIRLYLILIPGQLFNFSSFEAEILFNIYVGIATLTTTIILIMRSLYFEKHTRTISDNIPVNV